MNFAVRFLFAGILLSTIVLYVENYTIAVGGLSSVGASGIIMGASVLASSLTTFLSGKISDGLSNRALITVPSLCCLGFGFALLGAVPSLPATLVSVAAIGAGVGGTNPPLLAYLGDLSPEASVGKLGGLYNIFGDLGSMLGPLVAIPIAAAVGYRIGYLFCSMIALLSLALVVRTLLNDHTVTDSDGSSSTE